MLYLYLDESGDMGFDFISKKPSRYFTITILAVKGFSQNRQLINSVKKTLRRKFKGIDKELKGAKTTIEVKKYFYKQCENLQFKIYALSLNKKRVFHNLTHSKERLYNFVARNVIDQIPVEKNEDRIYFYVDKSKSRREIEYFNNYIYSHLKGRIDPEIKIEVYHRTSNEIPGIQAVDLFSWGIFRKHEIKDFEWFDIFKKKVGFDKEYLPQKK